MMQYNVLLPYKEQDSAFRYLALELCDATLHEVSTYYLLP